MKAASPEQIHTAHRMALAGASGAEIGRAVGRSRWWGSKMVKQALGERRDRPFQVGVRLSPQEMEALDLAARKNGRSWSAEIRARLNGPV